MYALSLRGRKVDLTDSMELIGKLVENARINGKNLEGINIQKVSWLDDEFVYDPINTKMGNDEYFVFTLSSGLKIKGLIQHWFFFEEMVNLNFSDNFVYEENCGDFVRLESKLYCLCLDKKQMIEFKLQFDENKLKYRNMANKKVNDVGCLTKQFKSLVSIC